MSIHTTKMNNNKQQNEMKINDFDEYYANRSNEWLNGFDICFFYSSSFARFMVLVLLKQLFNGTLVWAAINI